MSQKIPIRLLFMLFFLFYSLFLIAGEIIIKPGPDQVIYSSIPFQSLDVTADISHLSFLQVQTRLGMFTGLSAGNFGFSNIEGDPRLPVYRKLIEVPVDAGYDVRVTYCHYQDIRLDSLGIRTDIIPAQAPVPKDISSPEKMPFVKNEAAYQQNRFSSVPLVRVSNAGTMRAIVLARIDISPVQYNPVTKTIRVYDRIEARILFTHPDLPATRKLLSRYSSPFYTSSYSRLPNYPDTSDSLITSSPVTYVIVSHPRFKNTLKRFIAWKTRKGFKVITAYTGDPNVGNTTASIKVYLQGLYNNPPEGCQPPSFILFAGDVGLIPAWNINAHPSDMFYCEYTSDHIPDVFYGRFAAENEDQMNVLIDKTLEYEQFTMPDDAFLNEVVMTAGADDINGPLYGNGQVNYGTINYFNAGNNILSHSYLQPEPAGSNYARDIHNNISDGVAFANYTAHGSQAGWADPSFTVEDIPLLQNAHKYCLMVGNCCKTADFSVGCFAKEITRVANKGALGYIGCSDDSFWDEDYWWACGFKPVNAQGPLYDRAHTGAFDKTFHDHGEPLSDYCITMGQMVQAGDLAVEESNSAVKSYYWETYCLLGDPSVSIYYSIPTEIHASFRHEFLTGTTGLNVSTEPMAYVALSLNDSTLLDAKSVDSSGLAILHFPPVNHPCYARLIITRQNRRPFSDSIRFILPNWPSGTGGTSPAENISIYPIPFTDRFTITINTVKPGYIGVTLFDTYGKIVNRKLAYEACSAGQQQLTVTTVDLDPGIYFCRIETETFSEIRKVILTR